MKYWPHFRLVALICASIWIFGNAWMASACTGMQHRGGKTTFVTLTDQRTEEFAVCLGIIQEGGFYEVRIDRQLAEQGTITHDDQFAYYHTGYQRWIISVFDVPVSRKIELTTEVPFSLLDPEHPERLPDNIYCDTSKCWRVTEWAFAPEEVDANEDGVVGGQDFPAIRQGLQENWLTGFDFAFFRGLLGLDWYPEPGETPEVRIETDNFGRKVIRDAEL